MQFNKRLDSKSYNEWAQQYNQHIEMLSAPLAKTICDLAEIQPGQTVLDVGCGSGIATREAAQRVKADGCVVGIDLSDGLIRVAKTIGGPSSLNYMVLDAEQLGFRSQSFDSVISLCAVLHFPNIMGALDEMKRVLRPEGKLVVSYGSDELGKT